MPCSVGGAAGHHLHALPTCHAVSEVLRAIISTYREVFKAPNLTDAVLFSNYAVAALVVDEVVREVRCAQPQRSAAQRNTAQERARAAASMACWQGMGLAGCALVARGLGERCSRQPPGLPKASGMRTASQLAAVPLGVLPALCGSRRLA